MGTDSGTPYESLDALRRAHLEFIQSHSEGISHSEHADQGAADIRSFIARARATGAVLTDRDDRKAAQGILDYWSSELVNLPGVTARDFMPTMLAPPDPVRAAQASGEPAPSDAKSDQRSREIIRMAAAARLWRDSGKKHGYLLFGEAIAQAAKFRKLDPDIADLVDASEEARNSTVRLRWYVAATAFVVISGWLLFQFEGLPILSKSAIAKIKEPSSRGAEFDSAKSSALWRLGLYQLFLPPFDLSGARSELSNVRSQKLKLYAPNFSQARFDKVDFQEADFRAASFSGTEIKGPSNFSKADLSLAQFRDARIAATSFAEAELYRAIFDRACFGDVDFSGADLQDTSFWAVTLDEKSERHFDNTAWWFAVGWNSSQIGKLVKRDQSKLKENRFFVEYKKRNRSSVADVAAGTIARANTLNGLAWTLATWGLDITRTKDAAVEPEQACSKVMNVTDVPDNALDAAEQAVCIAKTLNEAGDTKGKYGLWLANFQDTRAYILMQTPGRMADAVDTYRKDVIPVLTSGEVLFRYAVAQLALGNKDGTAMADLRKSIAEQYFPSHELQHLNKYIEEFPAEIKDAFQAEVYGLIDKFWPALPPRPNCPPTSSAQSP